MAEENNEGDDEDQGAPPNFMQEIQEPAPTPTPTAPQQSGGVLGFLNAPTTGTAAESDQTADDIIRRIIGSRGGVGGGGDLGTPGKQSGHELLESLRSQLSGAKFKEDKERLRDQYLAARQQLMAGQNEDVVVPENDPGHRPAGTYTKDGNYIPAKGSPALPGEGVADPTGFKPRIESWMNNDPTTWYPKDSGEWLRWRKQLTTSEMFTWEKLRGETAKWHWTTRGPGGYAAMKSPEYADYRARYKAFIEPTVKRWRLKEQSEPPRHYQKHSAVEALGGIG